MWKFLWNGSKNEEKIPLIAWESLCKPKKIGGVGLRRWRDVNKALGAKLIWEMYEHSNQLWVKILQAKYLDSTDPLCILTVRNPPKGSAVRNFMLEYRPIITKHLSWHVGNGERASFWHDFWNGFDKLSDIEGLDNLTQIIEDVWGTTVDCYVEEV